MDAQQSCRRMHVAIIYKNIVCAAYLLHRDDDFSTGESICLSILITLLLWVDLEGLSQMPGTLHEHGMKVSIK